MMDSLKHLPFDLTPHRLQLLGLLLLIQGLLLAKWYNPHKLTSTTTAKPITPDVTITKVIKPDITVASIMSAWELALSTADPPVLIPHDRPAETTAIIAVFTKVHDDLAGKTKYLSAQQVFADTLAGNAKVLDNKERQILWAPFFNSLSKLIQSTLQTNHGKTVDETLQMLAIIWEAVITVLTKHL